MTDGNHVCPLTRIGESAYHCRKLAMQKSLDSRPRLRTMRVALLSATSLICIFLETSKPAASADFPVKAVVDSAYHDRWFASFEAGYLFNSSQRNLHFDPTDAKLGDLSSLRPGKDGFFVGAAAGRTFGPDWDWLFAYRFNSLGTSRTSASDPDASASNRFWFHHLDFEIGHHRRSAAGVDIRTFAGLRLAHARNRMLYEFEDGGKFGDFDHDFDHSVDLWAAGPRLGMQALFRQPGSAVGLKTSGAASILFSGEKNKFRFMTDDTSGRSTPSSSTFVYNIEGSVALVIPIGAASLELGYQTQQWWNLTSQIRNADSDGNFSTRRGSVLVHGPMARITIPLH